jgi:hypothetical protein
LNGRPLSRAKAQTKRDTDATPLKLATVTMATIRRTRAVDAAFDPVLYAGVGYRILIFESNYLRRIKDFDDWQRRVRDSLLISDAEH